MQDKRVHNKQRNVGERCRKRRGRAFTRYNRNKMRAGRKKVQQDDLLV